MDELVRIISRLECTLAAANARLTTLSRSMDDNLSHEREVVLGALIDIRQATDIGEQVAVKAGELHGKLAAHLAGRHAGERQ